jgi:succinate dehydrogenase / fumarate reductase, cytochrome b subunit
MHLYHGTWAVFRTLGIARPTPTPLKRRLSVVLAAAVVLGFAAIPIGALVGAFPDAPSPVMAEGH